MSKKKNTKNQNPPSTQNGKSSFLDHVESKNALIITIIIVLITLFLFYKPFIFDKLEPTGGDRIASIGETHQTTEY
ncbi:MAG: hypothetical protein JW866_10955, partial [Ignavibacteriales bacterium]|nr:hypothetical protein [Ignavibacteriales bacterium]